MYIMRYLKLVSCCTFSCRQLIRINDSTILSQLVMTLGGSLIPGALGAMLIEILPFLRNIASDIQRVLGDDNPALVPTVMFAYALTSLMIGALFIALGVFKAGILVSCMAYFYCYLPDSNNNALTNASQPSLGSLFSQDCAHRHYWWYRSFIISSRVGDPALPIITSCHPFIFRSNPVQYQSPRFALCFLRSSTILVIFHTFQ